MRVAQIAQHAEDLDRAAAFYSHLVGSDPVAVFDPPGLLFFALDGTRLLLDRNAPSALVYFPSTNIEEDVTRLRAAGATLETEPHVIYEHLDDRLGPVGTQEWQAFVRDPEGNLVGLVEHRSTRPSRT